MARHLIITQGDHDGGVNSPNKRDWTNENFAKASDNIIWPCDKISRQYGADIIF
jgi:hypothetical protein